MNELLAVAQRNGIYYEYAELPANGSVSMRFSDGSCAFALDNRLECRPSEARVHAAHELGHCMTGAFYNEYAALDVRGKHEKRADAWAIRELMPWPEVREAMRHGCAEAYDLAEWFGVTEAFARKAMEMYGGEV